MNRNKLFLPLVVCVFSLASIASAGSIISENFDGATVGDSLADLDANWGGGGNYTVVADPAGGNRVKLNAFGPNAWTFVNYPSSPGSDFSCIMFDVFFDSTLGSDAWLRLATSQATGNAAFMDIGTSSSSGPGSLIVVPQDQNVSVATYANNTGAPATAPNGATIPDGEVQFWVAGALAGTQTGFNGTGNFDGIGLWLNDGGTDTMPVDMMFMDNLEYSDCPVPEPTTLALFGLGCLAMLGLRRNRNA